MPRPTGPDRIPGAHETRVLALLALRPYTRADLRRALGGARDLGYTTMRQLARDGWARPVGASGLNGHGQTFEITAAGRKALTRARAHFRALAEFGINPGR